MSLRGVALGSALAVAGCGGASKTREFEGQKMACIVALEGALKEVERFDKEISDIALKTERDVARAQQTLARFKDGAGSEQVRVNRYCAAPGLQGDPDVRTWFKKFILATGATRGKLVQLLGGEAPEGATTEEDSILGETIPMGPEI